jgi:PAS domain S-box-containing protein
VLLSVTALRDETGAITGYLGVASDITKRKEAEAALRASEEKLRNLFELSSVGIALTDMEGRYVEFNAAFLRIVGYAAEELRNLDYWVLTPDDYLEAEQSALEQMARTGRYTPFEKEYIRKDGSRVPILLSGARVTGSDGAQYIWSIIEDMSQQKRTEQSLIEAKVRAEAANQAKTEFLANVSHELRTPLNGVIALADALGKTRLDDRQQELVEIISRSSVALEGILSQILDLSKVEAGHVAIAAQPLDLVDQVRQAVEVLRGKAEDRGLWLRLESAPGAEGWFLGDAGRIRQVVSNLVANAVKFTETGGITVTLQVEDGAEGAPAAVTIAVVDTGIGIDPDVLPRLFERFTQADESITRRFGGTGLGLSISRQLARLMGGDLLASSAAGAGSRFVLALPLARTADPAPPPPAPDAGALDAEGLRILLAEDHPVNRRVIELLLEPLGVTLTMAEDGHAAVEAFRAGGFDLVLMDMQMPHMDGLAATRAIRAAETATGAPRTPVIMLTANSFDTHRDQAFAAGADAFLAKPVTVDALMTAISGLAED